MNSRYLLVVSIVVMSLWPMKEAVAERLPEEQRYWTGYQVGCRDAQQRIQRQWEDLFIAAGYQRGVDETQERLRQKPVNGGTTAQEATVSSVDESNTGSTMETTQKLPLSFTQRQFINRLVPQARQLGKQYDLYPSILLAQAALESNWGHSELAANYHNLFGIKALPGQRAISLLTREDSPKGMVSTRASFCHYRDDNESLSAYARLLQSPLYAGVHRSRAATYQEAAKALTGVFATDSHYHQKISQIINAYQLDQYDQSPAKQTPQKPLNKTENKRQLASRQTPPKESSHSSTKVEKKKLAWYWWPISVISGGSLTWFVDFWRHSTH